MSHDQLPLEDPSIGSPPTDQHPFATADLLFSALTSVLEGQESTIQLALACLIGGGHLLLEDAPGTGKTTLARTLARASGLDLSRVQMTADLLPSDITGARYPTMNGDVAHGAQSLRFVEGPLFAQLVVADELNRTPPRTQSALLEAMAEGAITVDGERHRLPDPFFVVATQNPAEFAGTYPLPESQLDRFMMCLHPGYPSPAAERRMLRRRRGANPIGELTPVTDAKGIRALRASIEDVSVADPIESDILAIVEATRRSPEFSLGASPRATLDLDRASRALARLNGRDFVVPDDVRTLAVPVLAHRLVARDMPAGPEQRATELLLEALLEELPAPQLGSDGTLRK